MELTKHMTKEDERLLSENSPDDEALLLLLQEIKIYLGEPILTSHFEEDEKKGIRRNVYTVTVKRGDVRVSFKYGDSIHNTQDRKTPCVYDILACIQSDYHCPEKFKYFCSDFGYDEDSIATYKLFKRSQRQSQKLRTIFSEEEIGCLPQ